MSMTKCDAVSEALFDALTDTNDEALVRLQEALVALETGRPQTWKSLRRIPFMRDLLDAMKEASNLILEREH